MLCDDQNGHVEVITALVKTLAQNSNFWNWTFSPVKKEHFEKIRFYLRIIMENYPSKCKWTRYDVIYQVYVCLRIHDRYKLIDLCFI